MKKEKNNQSLFEREPVLVIITIGIIVLLIGWLVISNDKKNQQKELLNISIQQEKEISNYIAKERKINQKDNFNFANHYEGIGIMIKGNSGLYYLFKDGEYYLCEKDGAHWKSDVVNNIREFSEIVNIKNKNVYLYKGKKYIAVSPVEFKEYKE